MFYIKQKISQHRRAIDIIIRVGVALFFALGAGVCLRSACDILLTLQSTAGGKAHILLKAVSVGMIGLFNFMIALLYVRRLRAIETSSGFFPILAAVSGGFLMSTLAFFNPRDDLPLYVQIVACALLIIGNVLSVLVLMWLGRSFSIIPESRRLVTSGPYSIVRHPLYVVEAIATLGGVINFLSIWTVLLFLAQILLQLVRMNYEEAILKKTFPEYEAYAKRTNRLIPGLY